MNETTVVTVVTTLGVGLVIFVLGMWLKSVATNWRNQLVRECSSQLPGLERHLIGLAAKLDRLDERSTRQSAEIRRIHDYLLPPSQPR